MPIELSNAGKPVLLDKERVYLNTCYVCLYANDYVPDGNMSINSFQAPADTGLKQQKLLAFGPAVINAASEAELLAPPLTWTATFDHGALTIYGYFVIDMTNNTVLYAERAPAPFPVTGAGQTYSVTPRKQMDTM